MSANTLSSLDDLTQALLDERTPHICVERQAFHDAAPALLAKAHQLHFAGERILVVCADAVALQRCRAIAKALPNFPPDCLLTMRELCVRILSEEPIEVAVGRRARVLNENEHDVLLEDMKVSAVKPRRLREMLKFFYRSISDGVHEESQWLVTSEEQMIFAMLEENLEVRGAWLPCQLASAAYRGLEEVGTCKLDEGTPLIVLSDDFGALSKTSQRLLDRLGRGGLVVAGSSLAAIGADESYPYSQGLQEYANRFGVRRMVLDGENAQRNQQTVAYLDPAQEFTSVAKEVSARISQGVAPCDILVSAPNATWCDRLAEALVDAGVRVRMVAASVKIKGDPRRLDRCSDLKLATFLKLYLDDSDMVALRSWIGLGDWLLSSEAFLELMAYARENNTNVLDSLIDLHARGEGRRPVTLFKKFDRALDELAELKCACVGASQDEVIALFEHHGMPLHPSMIALLGSNQEQPDIENLAKYAFVESFEEVDGADRDCVVVAPFRICHSRRARITFVTGLVNGFLPALDAVDDAYTIDHRKAAIARDSVLFDDVCATAEQEIICSYFKRDRFENVGAMKMQMTRVFIKDSVRYANVSPSDFVINRTN